MSMRPFNISRLSSGGLITNYYCSSACRHCLYRCHPKWPKEYITRETAEKNLQKISGMGCRSIHIGGGEPMLNIPGLLDVLNVAKSNGIYIDYVETNSSWYSDHDSCCRILEKLPRQGVSTLLVSISPFHNEFIPFYKVKGVIQACRSTGIQVFPWISDFYSEIDQLDDSQKHTMQEYAELFGPNYEKQLLNRYWISPGGRALDLLRRHKPVYTVDEILAANPMGCSELTGVSHFHIDLYNNYIPGLCTGLAIHREDLGKPLLPQEYPFLNILYNKGIQAFFKYAQENTGFTPGKDTYINKCELCFEIRSCFINSKNITSKELHPVQHYMA